MAGGWFRNDWSCCFLYVVYLCITYLNRPWWSTQQDFAGTAKIPQSVLIRGIEALMAFNILHFKLERKELYVATL